MPQPIAPIVTHCQIHGYHVDVDGQAITISYSEGVQDGDTYTPIRHLEKRIEGEAFAALCNRAVKIEEPSQSYITTLYEVIKGEFYARIP